MYHHCVTFMKRHKWFITCHLSDNGCLILNSLQSLVRKDRSDVQMATEWTVVCYAAQ